MSSLSDAFEELGELDLDNIGSWPIWAHVGAIIIAAAVILGVGSWYFVLPKQDTLHQMQRHEQELKQKFISDYKQVASYDDYKKQLATIRARFGKQLSKLPKQSEIPDLLNDISQTRLASGLKEQLFKPRSPIEKDFYVILPNAMTVTGSYHELADFVSQIAAMSRIVTLTDANIVPTGKAGDGTLRMDMTINTYRYRSGAQ